MKVSLTVSLVCVWFLTAFANPASAMGQRAQLFEKSTEAGIWDHGNEFYLRMDLAELADLKDQKFVWAGFKLGTDGLFHGEVVADDFGVNEKHFPARAKLVSDTSSGRYFIIEILNEKGEVIKEFFLKGPPSLLPTR
ncbi:hypothetical protein [Oligoflexus tunisiensis]|uniref:hypothetical protein n=1 Tax=Oligoflexus tunisiensis TaxID=708132 RepID=UPI00114D24E3|nr:hypothetical protein [Oligoflexus tunisiensis]